MTKKQIIKNILLAILWTGIGSGTVVLLIAAIQQKDAKKCSSIEISISGVSNNFFVDKKDVLNTLISICGRKPVGKTIGSFDLKAMETALQKNVWIRSAQLFFDNNEKLQVNVLEREPVARVFSNAGTTFYIDSSVAMLPLSDKFSARLPVFTNFPSDKKVLLKADSNLLRDIVTLSMAVTEDSFYMAMIDQIDITAQRTFEMIPKFGNTVLVFGDAKNAAEKLGKIQLFYKEIMVKAGWNKYSEINVQYRGQVVAKRKGAAEVKADSLRTLQLMKMIAENAERLAADTLQTITQDNEHNTTNNNIIQQSIERDDNNPSSSNAIEEPKPQEPVTNEKPATHFPEEAPQDAVPDGVNKPSGEGKKRVVTLVNTGDKPIVKPEKPEHTGPKKRKLVMPKPVVTKPTNEY